MTGSIQLDTSKVPHLPPSIYHGQILSATIRPTPSRAGAYRALTVRPVKLPAGCDLTAAEIWEADVRFHQRFPGGLPI